MPKAEKKNIVIIPMLNNIGFRHMEWKRVEGKKELLRTSWHDRKETHSAFAAAFKAELNSVLLHVVNFSNFLFLLALAQLMLAIMWNFMLTTHSQQLCVWAFCLGSSSSYSLTLWDFNSTWIIWSKINRALKRLRERIITLCVCTHFMNLLPLPPPPLSMPADGVDYRTMCVMWW